MSKEICISSTPHETRLAILEDDQLSEIYYERENEYTLAGSIYKGRVTRVLPGMQSAFVDVGLERDAFLYVTDFLEEQEDSADFERVGGSGAKREAAPAAPAAETAEPREARPPREAREPREGRGNREPREPREPREAREPRQTTAIEVSHEVTPAPVPFAGADDGEDEDSPEGTRRWRGRRGRRRGGRSQQQRDADAARSPEVRASEPAPAESPAPAEEYRSVAPSTPAPTQAPTHAPIAGYTPPPPATPPAPGQPALLPGESLSRYGSAPAPSAAIVVERDDRPVEKPLPVRELTPSAKPSTLVEAPIEWNGGLMLGGESISRYRNQPPAESPAPAKAVVAHEPSHEAAAAHEHVATSEAPTEPSVTGPESSHAEFEHASPAETSSPEHQDPPSPELAASHAGDQNEQTPSGHAGVELPPLQEPELIAEALPTVAAPLEFEESSSEFEPEDASASHRIDPSAPSEFRISSTLEEEPEASALPAPPHEAIPEVDAYTTPGEEIARPFDLPADEPPSPSTVVPPSDDSYAVEYEDEVTTEKQQAPAPAEVPAATETEDEEAPRNFAPGAGVLEEEVLDEEEYDFEPISGHTVEHDNDQLEEETLDHQDSGTEIGEMVRDAHLDQRMNIAFGSNVSTEEEGAEEAEEENGELEEGSLEIDEDFEEDESEEEGQAEPGTTAEAAPDQAPAPRRDGRRDDARRGGRGRHGRRRTPGSEGGRGGERGGRRANSQTSDLPIISELLKQGQEILVQIAKEPIAKKGARITSHIALPGRFLVFMPTVNHVGVSRKIASDEERLRLKRILISEKGTNTGGFIVRTAAEGASEEELRADIRFLISLWSEIKQRSDEAKAPALIYHDLNLVERILRDQVSDNFSTIWVDSEVEYERIVRFLNRFQPSLVRRVKLYTKETPLFEQFGIQDEISKALKSKVWLKSGGSIVINQTEALVAIDINTGKYVGKTARLEDTILKTNLDAIPEIVRQIRLRDLGGIIVIDFIDMDERKNRHRVMQALEDELKNDRAPSKVLQFNDFGLVAITRKRVKQSLERTLSVQCGICAGTGMVKSPVTVCNEIYVEMRKMQKLFDKGDVLLRVHPDVVKALKEKNAHWLNELEEMTGKTIIVKSDAALHPEQFDIH